jgi:hypothetical protein
MGDEASEDQHYLIDLEPKPNYSPADLTENRLGRISSKQRRRLWTKDIFKTALSMFLILFGLVGLFAGFADRISARATGGAAVAVMLGFVLAWGSAGLWIDLLRGRVQAITGDLQTQEKVDRRDTYYYLVVGSHRWDIAESFVRHVVKGPGVVYQLPISQTILSLETTGGDLEEGRSR